MIFSIKSKNRRNKSGHLKFTNSDGFSMNLGIQGKGDFFKEFQELLMKYYDVKILSAGKEITSKLIIDKLKDEYNNSSKLNNHKGVGRSLHESERYKNDAELRERKKDLKKNWRKKNKEYINKKFAERTKTLNEFADKHCEICNVLLNYKTKSGRCGKHKSRSIAK